MAAPAEQNAIVEPDLWLSPLPVFAAEALGPDASELGLLVSSLPASHLMAGSSPALAAAEDPVQVSVEELFEDLSHEMPPVPFAGAELFRGVIRPQFGEGCAGMALPPATTVWSRHMPCMQLLLHVAQVAARGRRGPSLHAIRLSSQTSCLPA